MKKELVMIMSDEIHLTVRKFMRFISVCCCHLLFRSAPLVPHESLVTSEYFVRSHTVYGSPGRARTADLMINSHPLYRLSYRGIDEDDKSIFLFGQDDNIVL